MTSAAVTASPAAATAETGSRRRLVGGGAWGAADFLMSTLLGLPLTVVLVRVLPRDVFGDVATATAIAALIGMVVSVGLADSVARTLTHEAATAAPGAASSRSEQVVSTALWLSAATAIVGGALTILVALAVSSSRIHGADTLIAIAVPLVLVAPVHTVLVGLVRATYRPRLSFLASTAASVVALVGLVVMLAAGVRTGAPIVAMRAGAAALGAAVLAVGLRPALQRRPPSRAIARELLRVGGAVMLVSVAAIAISQLDIVTIGLFHGARMAGVYAPLSRLLDLVTAAYASLGAYALVTLTDAGARSTDGLARQYHWCTRWTVVCLGPALGVLIVAPGPVLHLLFGAEPASAPTVVRILALAACLHVGLGYNGLTLIALGESGIVLLQGAVALAASIAACLLLVPRFGLDGAAVATAVALVASNLVCSWSLWRRHGIAPVDQPAGLTCGAFALVVGAGAGLTGLHRFDLAAALALGVVVAAVTGAVALWQSGGATAPELVAVRRSLKRTPTRGPGRDRSRV